jgi:hypothetical protein
MMVLPRTQAPIAIFQLSPAAIMEEAKYAYQHCEVTFTTRPYHIPTSQLETAQASAIQ